MCDEMNQEPVSCAKCEDGCDFGDTVNGLCEKCQPIDHNHIRAMKVMARREKCQPIDYTIGTDVEALKRHIEASKVFVATHHSCGGLQVIGIYKTRSLASIAIIRSAGGYEESYGWYEIEVHILNHTPISNVGR